MAGAHRGAEAVAVFATVLALAACGTQVEEDPVITVGPALPTEHGEAESGESTDDSDPTVTPPAASGTDAGETATVQPIGTAPDSAGSPTKDDASDVGPDSTSTPSAPAPSTGLGTTGLETTGQGTTGLETTGEGTTGRATTAPPATTEPPGEAGPGDAPGALPEFSGPDDVQAMDAAGAVQLIVDDVRVGVQDGYDRVVLDLSGPGEVGWRVEYVTDPVLDGSGIPVDLAGDFVLRIDLQGMAYPEAGDPAYEEGLLVVDGGDLTTVTELLRATPFEGQLPVFVGTRAEAPFRVFRLSDPERLVIDLQH